MPAPGFVAGGHLAAGGGDLAAVGAVPFAGPPTATASRRWDPDGRRSRLAQVGDEWLSGRLAKNAEQGDQGKKTREDRLDAEIRERRRAVLQVVGFIFLQCAPASCEP